MGKDVKPFSVVRKKNPFQKHKEEEKTKKERAEAEAAALYDEFVASFEADEGGAKTFVHGETIQPGSSASASASTGGSSKKKKYVPSFLPPALAGTKKPEREEKSVFASSKPDKSKPKAIDMMLEEIKKEQERREERDKARAEGRSSAFDVLPSDPQGSFDDGDPFTTNLYVGNLAPEVDEEVLKREFGQFGPIASVKVMWPRSDEERRRGRNCGFVAFMARDGAQAARDNLDGRELGGHELHVGWGKAVPIPAFPIYPPPEGLAAGRMGAVAPPALPWGPGPPTPSRRVGGSGFSTGGPTPPLAPLPPSAIATVEAIKERPKDPEHIGNGPDIRVVVPEPRQRFIIDTLADYVSVDGSDFEQAVMEKERNNPEFAFLYDLSSPDHAYYRWRLYSLLQGDSLKAWRTAQFVMVKGSAAWIPPPMTSDLSSSRTAASRGGTRPRDRSGKPLSDTQRDRFEDMLRGLTVEQDSIREAMAFCLDNAESAHEISEIISEALTIPETPPSLKVARLFLVSDVLHNSTAPVKNASNFRTRLQESLPDIFESLAECSRACDSRMTQETLRRHVLRVLRVWRGWFIFSDDFLNGLQASFLYIGSQAALSTPRDEKLDKELEELDNEALARRCRLNGLSTSKGRVESINLLLALDSYLRGDAQQPILEGSVLIGDDKEMPQEIPKPLAEGSTPGLKKKRERAPKGSVSKWAMMDVDNVEAGDDSDGSDIFSGDERDSNAKQNTQTRAGEPPRHEAPPAVADADDEERRQRLRQVEVEVMMLRENLEEEGLGKEEIEKRVASKRAELIAAFDNKAAQETGNPSGEDHEGCDNHVKEKGRDAEMSKAQDKERGRDREADRSRPGRDNDRDKDKERERERDRNRDRDRRRSPNPRRRSRSRTRSPKRSRGSPARRDSGRHR